MNEEAIIVLDEWLLWLFKGKLAEEGILIDIRKGLMEIKI